jgi:hypothetical protein
VPCLPADGEDKVSAATTKLADQRVLHYWDTEGKLRNMYRDLMQWDQPAWDVYYVYGPKAEWKKSGPPTPDFWMHQLRGLPIERRLNGEKLAAEIKRLLAAK